MTEDEKRQQKGMLLLEYQEAEDNLAHLEEKAKRVSKNISAVSKWLEDRTRGYTPAGGGDDKVYVDNRYIDIQNNPEIVNAMDFEAAKSLALEIKEARRKVQELAERKKSLGVK